MAPDAQKYLVLALQTLALHHTHQTLHVPSCALHRGVHNSAVRPSPLVGVVAAAASAAAVSEPQLSFAMSRAAGLLRALQRLPGGHGGGVLGGGGMGSQGQGSRRSFEAQAQACGATRPANRPVLLEALPMPCSSQHSCCRQAAANKPDDQPCRERQKQAGADASACADAAVVYSVASVRLRGAPLGRAKFCGMQASICSTLRARLLSHCIAGAAIGVEPSSALRAALSSSSGLADASKELLSLTGCAALRKQQPP